MIILGIDPGLRITGFGVIHKQGNKLTYIASGTIKTADADLPSRLKTILAGVSEVVRTYQPDCAAVEKVFVNVNPQSTLLLGQARGAAICALVHNELLVSEYTALQVKQAFPEAVLIFILPPSWEELRARLENRGEDSPEVIELRLKNASEEMAQVQKFDFVIINELFETALFDLKAIIHAQRLKYAAQRSARADTFESLNIT